MTTMNDLYPGGAGYHSAHEAYLRAVAEAFRRGGYFVDDWSAEPNDPRDGFIGLDAAMNGEAHDASAVWASSAEVNVAWNEDRGWALVTVDCSSSSDGRFVYDLSVARVASPATVVLAAAERIGEVCAAVTDEHPDLDFPEHSFEDDDIAFELALRHYAKGAS